MKRYIRLAFIRGALFKLWHYIWLPAVIVCLVCAVLYWRNGRKVTGFSALVHTRSISFRIGHWTESAGIFVDGITRVNMRLPAACKITAARVPPLTSRITQQEVILRNVRIQSLDTSEGLQVTIDVEAGALFFTLQRKEPNKKEFVTVLLDRKSAVEGEEEIRQLAADKDSEELLIGRDGDAASFSFSTQFLYRETLPPEKGIRLADGGFVYFQYEGESRITGSGNRLEVQETHEKYPIMDGLRLEKLRDAQINELSPHVADLGKSGEATADVDWLDASVVGRSNQIYLVNGGRAEAKAPLRSVPDSWSSWFQALFAMMSAAVALYKVLPRKKRLIKTLK